MAVIHNPLSVTRQPVRDSAATPFKVCSMCRQSWPDALHFIADTSLAVNGYQAFFDNPERGLILFTHKVEGCGSTIAVPAGAFKPLYHGPEYSAPNHGRSTCCGHCRYEDDFEQCQAQCDMHWVRDILQLLRRYRQQ